MRIIYCDNHCELENKECHEENCQERKLHIGSKCPYLLKKKDAQKEDGKGDS